MKRVEFVLSMPSRKSWDGRWTGEDRHYAITKRMSDKAFAKLQEATPNLYWFHRWDDGWGAGITARVVPTGERVKKSDGFSGYGWMVDNILDHGNPYAAKGVQ